MMRRIKRWAGSLGVRLVEWAATGDSQHMSWAREELQRAGLFDEDGDFYGGMTGTAVLRMVALFSLEGHSGMSASVCSGIFRRVAAWRPLSPLQGDDPEWGDPYDDDGSRQNRRCSAVFRDGATGQVSYIDGFVFNEPDGVSYTSGRFSRRNLTLPCGVPDPVHLDVPKDASDEAMLAQLRGWLDANPGNAGAVPALS